VHSLSERYVCLDYVFLIYVSLKKLHVYYTLFVSELCYAQKQSVLAYSVTVSLSVHALFQITVTWLKKNLFKSRTACLLPLSHTGVTACAVNTREIQRQLRERQRRCLLIINMLLYHGLPLCNALNFLHHCSCIC